MSIVAASGTFVPALVLVSRMLMVTSIGLTVAFEIRRIGYALRL